MPGVGDDEFLAVQITHSDQNGGEMPVSVYRQLSIALVEDEFGWVAVQGVGANREAEAGHDRGRSKSPTGHITDYEDELSVTEVHHAVPVPADVDPPGTGLVSGGHADPGDGGKGLR